MGFDDVKEKRTQALNWLHHGTPEQYQAALEYLGDNARPWCPEDCGCRLGPDSHGDHDADKRECGCDGPCTETG